jgi:hypothetical protein
MIKKVILAVVVAVLLSTACSACGGSPALGREFKLAVGQTVSIVEEGISVTFDGVSEDSRCPTGAMCIWEGRVVCDVSLVIGGVLHQIELIQPGLSDGYAGEAHEGYSFSFKVEPYPELEKRIAEGDYRLLLTIDR